MKREFLPYHESLELKELGFDEPCLFAFDNCSTPMRCSNLRTNEQKFNGVNYNSSTYTSQPTFSQAFRWFREKCGLDSIIQPTYSTKYQYRVFNVETKCKTQVYGDYMGKEFNTYEKAELACLRKLIEIVKQK